MSNSIERKIIAQALEYHALLNTRELRFVMRISRLPNHVRLSPSQSRWLYDIGRRKLDMVLPDPAPAPVIDYRSRAYA